MDFKNRHRHVALVEPYEGCIEYLSGDPEEHGAMQGLGLPLSELAELLNSRITVFVWEEWYRYERKAFSPDVPATQPVGERLLWKEGMADGNLERVKRISVPTVDPEDGHPLSARGLSPRSHGLINDGGLLSFLSYCLEKQLQRFHGEDPFDCLIVPMWGGLGYVTQMARACVTGDAVDVPVAVVVTDVSVNRQKANQEGVWTRHAIIRRQMEDLSLALADVVLVFGPRGKQIAGRGRLAEADPPLEVPRFVSASSLEKLKAASLSDQRVPRDALQFFLSEPQDASSGVLAALDAISLLNRKGSIPGKGFISAGPSMVFAPMKPSLFEEYWSSRGAVRELISNGQWRWSTEYPSFDGVLPVRLYPSLFDHLPNIWAELGKGSLVLLSDAAAEGLAPRELLPRDILIGEATPDRIAACMENMLHLGVPDLDRIRKEACAGIAAWHQSKKRKLCLERAVEALQQFIQHPPRAQDFSKVSRVFLDRRRSVQEANHDHRGGMRKGGETEKRGSLSVVVTCYAVGSMLSEAVESLWMSERRPDEVVLVDDGSQDEETLKSIEDLEREALRRHLPLTIVRSPNQGLPSARNIGLAKACGEFISFLDGDDLVEPPFYRIALQIFKKYPHLGGVAAWASIFGRDVPDGFWNAPQAELPFLFAENSVIVPCVMKTALLRDLGGYDVNQRYNYEDWELSIRMLASGWPIVTIPRHLVKYRIRRNSLYRTMTSVQNQVMRELLFETHRETVAKFSVEVALQLENLWKKSMETHSPPASSGTRLGFVGWFRRLNVMRPKRRLRLPII